MMKTGFIIISVCVLIAAVSGKIDPDPPADDDTSTSTTTQETTTVIHGNWGDWSSYSACSANCGTGTQYRSRSCDNPAPGTGGDDCVGDSTEATSCSASSECCAPQVFDVAFLIDVTFSSTQHNRIITFFKDVVGIFDISPSKTRISVATVGSTTSLLFSFTAYTTSDDITSQIDNIDRQYYSTANSKDALDFARGTMLTTSNGARSDVSDVLIMLISDVNTNDVDVSAQKLKDNGVTLMVAEETSIWTTSKIQSLADLYEGFSYVYSYTLGPVKTNIENGFPCNYFCGTSFFALDSPSSLSSAHDSSVGYLYLMTDSPYQVTCCGATSAWEFFAVSHGTVQMMVFRQTAQNTYYLVGYSTIIVPEEYVNTSVSFSLISTERIAIVSGDILGWYTSGSNMISHEECTTSSRADCPQNNKRISMPGATFTVGQTIDFSSAETVANRGYSIKVATANNSELTLTAIQNETEIEENTPIGYKVLYFRVIDPDLNDNTTWELSGQHSLFAMSDLANEQVQLLLQTKLPDGGGSYVITVKGIDSCQHTATATVTVSTYNAPPIINNLPYIMEISETTKTSIHLYTINVTDATNDPICCTMPYSLPLSDNFEFRLTDGVYSLWTVTEPAFAYNDNNAYRIFVCCQDNLGSTTLYLMLQILENKVEVPYVPPSWFYTAIGISMVPIALMTMFACATLIITMFFLDSDQNVEEEDETNLSELTETTSITPENGVTSPNLTENSSTIETVEETIQFKNLYNDEIVNIPIWRGKWKHAMNKVNAQNAWHGISENTRTQEFADDPYLEPRTKGDAFGVDLKLFHYGGRPINNVSEVEKAATIFQKKNTMREKWLETIEKAKEKKIIKKKSATNKISDEMKNAKKVEEIEETSPPKHVRPKRTVLSPRNVSPKRTDVSQENTDTNENEIVEATIENNTSQVNDVNRVASIETDDVNSASNENNSPEEIEDQDILDIFNEIVEPGTAAAGTNLDK